MRPAAASKLSSGLRLHRTYRVQATASLLAGEAGSIRVLSSQPRSASTGLVQDPESSGEVEAFVEDVWQQIVNSTGVDSPDADGGEHSNDRRTNRLQTTNHRTDES